MPSLTQVHQARWERDTADPANRASLARAYEARLTEILQAHPHLHREDLERALDADYPNFMRAQRRPSALPPRA